MSQTPAVERYLREVTTESEIITGARAPSGPFEIEALFRDRYAHVARIINGVLRDPARSEELAVEVFVKLWRTPSAHGDGAPGWLYRAAVRRALDEVRRRARRQRYERLMSFVGLVPSPEQVHSANETQKKVRSVLAVIKTRDAELLMLRNLGLSYDELAGALRLNPASVGTLLSRAQRAFREEYVTRYGEHE